MNHLSKIELAIIFEIYEIQSKTPRAFSISEGLLVETDEILRIRELVNYIENLVTAGYLIADENFYTGSESVSFKYMNNAVEIAYNKIRLTSLGEEVIHRSEKNWLKNSLNTINKTVDNYYRNRTLINITFLLLIILGFILGKLL